MNSVHLIGRLTRDPEVRYGAQSQQAVARFTIAINRLPCKAALPCLEAVEIVEHCVLRLKPRDWTRAVVELAVRALAVFEVNAVRMVVEGDLDERLFVLVVHEDQPVAAPRVVHHQLA